MSNSLTSLQNELLDTTYQECILGDKTVSFKIWSAKELINYDKALKSMDKKSNVIDIIMNNLLYPVLDEESKSKYLTEEEKMYLITLIREKTFPEMPLSYLFECLNVDCNYQEEIEIPVYTRKTTMYMNGELELSNGLVFVLGDIKNKDALKSKPKDEEDKFYEFIFRIEEIRFNGNIYDVITLPELKEIILSLPGNVFDELFNKYKDFSFSDIIENQKYKCPECGTESTLYLNDVTLFLRDI